MSEFADYLRGRILWMAFLITVFGDWTYVLAGVAGIAIVLIILVIKEGHWQKELLRRRALPASAIRGVSH